MTITRPTSNNFLHLTVGASPRPLSQSSQAAQIKAIWVDHLLSCNRAVGSTSYHLKTIISRQTAKPNLTGQSDWTQETRNTAQGFMMRRSLLWGGNSLKTEIIGLLREAWKVVVGLLLLQSFDSLRTETNTKDRVKIRTWGKDGILRRMGKRK